MVQYLRHIISDRTICIESNKQHAILDFLYPKTIKHLKQLLEVLAHMFQTKLKSLMNQSEFPSKLAIGA